MPTKSTRAPSPAQLRRLAEARLRTQPKKKVAKPMDRKSDVDPRRLLHELQVHQVELEMQNAELHETRDRMESLLEKYTDLYDFAPVGYFTLTADGTIQMVNLTGARLVGIDRGRLVGQTFAMLVSADVRPSFRSFLKKVFEGLTKQESDFELTSKCQPVKIVRISAQRAFNGCECSAVVVDVTEHRQAEGQVRVSEIRYRRLFEAAHDGVLLLDPATRKITDANPYMAELLGCQHDELVGKELFEIGLLKDEAASLEMFRKLKRQHQVRYEDLPLGSQGGRHQEVEVLANLYQEDGRTVIQCNIRDITARKQAADVLRRNEALLSALLAQAPFGVYLVDDRLRMIHVNPKAQHVFRNIQPLIGRDILSILQLLWPKRVSEEIVARFTRTLKTGEPCQAPEFAARRRDTGVREIYDWQMQRVTLPSGEHRVVVFFDDVTERRRAEGAQRRLEVMTASNQKLKLEIDRRRALEKSLKESEHQLGLLLTQSDLLQKRSRRLSHKILHAQEEERKRISRELHDVISQNLVGINFHLATLSKDAGFSEKLRQKIAHTQQLVEKSTKIVHRFARELRPTVLDDLGLIPALQSLLKSYTSDTGVRVTLKAFAGIEQVDSTIRTMLYRVAHEALTNAARHAGASRAEVVIKKQKTGICMDVKDDGIGFDVGAILNAKKNSRLGLLGMKERVEMLGGTFWVESAPGKTTTVHVEVAAEDSASRNG